MTNEEEKTVLVVDDDDSIRTMVERVLRRERFRVESARDGHEAIEKLARSDYATIVLDLMMPRVDGFGVLQFLMTQKPDLRGKVIVMTANLHGAREASETPPCHSVLPKPFDLGQLLERVRDAV